MLPLNTLAFLQHAGAPLSSCPSRRFVCLFLHIALPGPLPILFGCDGIQLLYFEVVFLVLPPWHCDFPIAIFAFHSKEAYHSSPWLPFDPVRLPSQPPHLPVGPCDLFDLTMLHEPCYE